MTDAGVSSPTALPRRLPLGRIGGQDDGNTPLGDRAAAHGGEADGETGDALGAVRDRPVGRDRSAEVVPVVHDLLEREGNRDDPPVELWQGDAATPRPTGRALRSRPRHASDDPVEAIACTIGTLSDPSTCSPQPSAAIPAAISSPGANVPAASTVVTTASTPCTRSIDATADSSPSPPSRNE